MSSDVVVYNPMGYSPKIEQKGLAPRPDSLDGKTVYLVDCRFDDSEILTQQMQEWFRDNMPSVRTELRRKSGVYTERDPQRYEEIQARGDAAVVAVGHCSTCAPAGAGQCFILETEYGVPTASIQTNAFEHLARAAAKQKGMPSQRFAFRPQPVMGKSPAERHAYVNGNDAVSGRPFMTEVLQALTDPLRDGDTGHATWERSTPRLVEPASERSLELFLENRWTDGLPIVLPTEERVAAMLEATSHAPDEIVGRMAPTAGREAWRYTVE